MSIERASAPHSSCSDGRCSPSGGRLLMLLPLNLLVGGKGKEGEWEGGGREGQTEGQREG